MQVHRWSYVDELHRLHVRHDLSQQARVTDQGLFKEGLQKFRLQMLPVQLSC